LHRMRRPRSRWKRSRKRHATIAGRGEPLDVEQAKLAVDAVRRSLDASEPQYFAVLHHDVDTDRYHVTQAI